MSKNDWCFWFRVYSINNGYRIEDFLGDEAMKNGLIVLKGILQV